MEEKVLIVKTEKDKAVKIGYIHTETIKDIYNNLYYADTLRILQNIERTFLNDHVSFSLEIVNYNDLMLELFNRKIQDQEKIIRYKTFSDFLINYSGNLALKGIKDERIKSSLISISIADNINEKETVIKSLYKQ